MHKTFKQDQQPQYSEVIKVYISIMKNLLNEFENVTLEKDIEVVFLSNLSAQFNNRTAIHMIIFIRKLKNLKLEDFFVVTFCYQYIEYL